MIIRDLTLSDAPALQRLMMSNAGYTKRVEGGDPSADAAGAVLTALPPAVDPGQKRDIGVWDGEVLVAFVDVIVGWPAPQMAHIGLLMTDGAREGRGLGWLLHDAVVTKLLARGGIETLRILIVDTNAAVAEPFWKKMGYSAAGQVSPYDSGTVSSTARTWTRPLILV